MASLLSDGNHPLEQEDDGGLVQKCHDAYAAQPDLPKDLAKQGIINPLGMEHAGVRQFVSTVFKKIQIDDCEWLYGCRLVILRKG